MSDLSIEADLPRGRPADRNLALLGGVKVRVSVEVGGASMRLADLLELGEGSVVELDRQANDRDARAERAVGPARYLRERHADRPRRNRHRRRPLRCPLCRRRGARRRRAGPGPARLT